MRSRLPCVLLLIWNISSFASAKRKRGASAKGKRGRSSKNGHKKGSKHFNRNKHHDPDEEMPNWMPIQPQCKREDFFTTTVIIEHELLHKNYKDPNELEMLATAFRETYNTLNAAHEEEAVCDDLLRSVEQVHVKPMHLVYKQYGEEEYATRRFSYEIFGKCDGCTTGSSLFDKDDLMEREELFSTMATPSTCKCYPSSQKIRAPTESEFKRIFNKEVSRLCGGRLRNTHSSQTIREVRGRNCEPKQDVFKSEVFVELSDTPNKKDLKIIEDTFANAYNEMGNDYCDPHFHTVSDVKMRHYSTGNHQRKLSFSEDRLFSASIRGICKDCTSDSQLFDDASDGRALTQGNRRNLRHRSECYCARHPRARRAPRVDEFAIALNDTLAHVSENGYISKPIHAVFVVS